MDPTARMEAALAGLSGKKLRIAQAGLGCSVANLFCFEAALRAYIGILSDIYYRDVSQPGCTTA